ncbi:MAG: hypothetical protein ABIZ04_15265 [Opitutus sp.]
MKKILIGALIGVLLGIAGAWKFRGAAPDDHLAAKSTAPEPAKMTPLHFSAAQRAAAEIKLAPPLTSKLIPRVQAFGRVLDSTPLVALISELRVAQAAAAASAKEYHRNQQLFAADTNASAQSVETAENAFTRDSVAVKSAQARLIAGWGRWFSDSDELRVAVENGATVARLELLAADAAAEGIERVNVGRVSGEPTTDAQVLGSSPVSDGQTQGSSYDVLLRESGIPIGAAIRATLPGKGGSKDVLVVPESALVYHQGSAWIFVLGEEDTFERKIVTTGQTTRDGIEIVTGVEAEQQVVINGAQQLLSAELQVGGDVE